MKFFRLLCLLLFLGSFSFQAQGQQRDIGVRITSLENISFIYKKQLKKENRYFRITGADFNLSLGETFQNSASIDLGWEKRKFHNDRFAFNHGWTTGLQWQVAYSNGNGLMNVIPNIGYLLGTHYKLNDHFYINVETNPKLSFLYNTQQNEGRLNLNAPLT